MTAELRSGDERDGRALRTASAQREEDHEVVATVQGVAQSESASDVVQAVVDLGRAAPGGGESRSARVKLVQRPARELLAPSGRRVSAS